VILYNDYEQVETWEDLDDLVKRMYGPVPITNRMVTPHLPKEWDEKNQYPWKNGEPVLFLGEVIGMPGHGVFVGKDGLVKFGYHTDSFKVIPKDLL